MIGPKEYSMPEVLIPGMLRLYRSKVNPCFFDATSRGYTVLAVPTDVLQGLATESHTVT
jgi:hypothetical protein